VALAALHPNPRQPRTHFDETALAELADSIRENGLLQPILVRPRTPSGYEIVAGERRYRAALRAGLSRVPVVVRNVSDDEALALALVENLLREDISPLETARAFRRLVDDFGLTQEELSRRVGKSRAAVANALRLLDLPDPIQESLGKGEITEGHARALLYKDAAPDWQQRVWQMIRQRKLSVREAERLIKTPPTPVGAFLRSGAAARPSPDLAAVEDRLRSALALKVRVVGTEGRGRIEIEYGSEEELDALLTRLTGGEEAAPAPARPTRGSDPIRGLLRSRRPA
jgi:ParB family chromosome partitioning protein